MHSRYIAVVGGVNLDISGTPAAPMIAGDSNPGEVQVTYGGVGRNIAENIARLGQSVKMITALGDDGYTTPLRAFCESSGIDMSYSGVILGMRNSTYLCINDEHGDVLYAIADMAICDRITPEFLEGRRSVLEKASLIVADANLSPETLVWLCESFDVPVMADPVSVTKSTRLLKALPHLYCVKPNRPEAEALSGIAIREDADLKTAAAVLLENTRNPAMPCAGRGQHQRLRGCVFCRRCARLPGRHVHCRKRKARPGRVRHLRHVQCCGFPGP